MVSNRHRVEETRLNIQAGLYPWVGVRQGPTNIVYAMTRRARATTALTPRHVYMPLVHMNQIESGLATQSGHCDQPAKNAPLSQAITAARLRIAKTEDKRNVFWNRLRPLSHLLESWVRARRDLVPSIKGGTKFSAKSGCKRSSYRCHASQSTMTKIGQDELMLTRLMEWGK